MKCINCHNQDWENVDIHRIKPQGMSICKKCGFVSYPTKWKSKEEIKKYYNSGYRNPPSASNFFSGQKKLNYHHAFLAEFIEKWNKKESFKVLDVGAAFGMFLTWFKSVVPKAELYGTEWDSSFRNNAYHEYGLTLTEEVDFSQKYDLISLYKVAEHILDFDEYLKKCVDCLTDDGAIYISAPVWFDSFYNFGPCNNDLEYYYHPDHVNQWSRKIFQSIINQAGLKIIRENFSYYDDTYLCVKGEATPAVYEDPEEIKDTMSRIKNAFLLFTEKKYKESIESFPNNPMAWRGNYEMNRKQFHEMGLEKLEEYLNQAASACPNSAEIISMGADIFMRYDNFDQAIKLWGKVLEMRPGASMYLSNMAHCFRKLWEIKQDPKYLMEARNICRVIARSSTENLTEALSWIYHDNARLGMPVEKVEVPSNVIPLM